MLAFLGGVMKTSVAIFMALGLLLMNWLVWKRFDDYKWDRNPFLIGLVTALTIGFIWIISVYGLYDESRFVPFAEREAACAEQGGVLVRSAQAFKQHVCVEAIKK
jgi:hypothetical protein